MPGQQMAIEVRCVNISHINTITAHNLGNPATFVKEMTKHVRYASRYPYILSRLFSISEMAHEL